MAMDDSNKGSGSANGSRSEQNDSTDEEMESDEQLAHACEPDSSQFCSLGCDKSASTGDSYPQVAEGEDRSLETSAKLLYYYGDLMLKEHTERSFTKYSCTLLSIPEVDEDLPKITEDNHTQVLKENVLQGQLDGFHFAASSPINTNVSHAVHFACNVTAIQEGGLLDQNNSIRGGDSGMMDSSMVTVVSPECSVPFETSSNEFGTDFDDSVMGADEN